MHDFIHRNRITVKPGNTMNAGFAERRRMKKVNVQINGTGNIFTVGRGSMVANCKIRVDGTNQTLRIGEDCLYHAGKIYLRYNKEQHIYIGDKTTIEDAYILTDEDASIEIGQDCMFSKFVHLRAGDGHSILNSESRERINRARNITIGNKVWVGRGVCMLKGAFIPDDCVVGAYAVVAQKYANSGSVIAGNPARVVREGVVWDRRML
jgi:acetyltransferase-like isoleucine patch superfamily enzyme